MNVNKKKLDKIILKAVWSFASYCCDNKKEAMTKDGYIKGSHLCSDRWDYMMGFEAGLLFALDPKNKKVMASLKLPKK